MIATRIAKRTAAATLLVLGFALSPGLATEMAAKPTIVLVHGALADASSWDRVIPVLEAQGYPVVAAANPLRSLKGDADYVGRLVKAIRGPVVLVGHSYGGAVISNAGAANVKALVYVAAFAPETGESAFDLVGKYPGSLLGAALAPPVALPDGAHDLYVVQDKFQAAFAADVSEGEAKLMAATQRPVTDVALKDPSEAPAWKAIPSWFIYGDADKSIPPMAEAYMAERAGARATIVVKGASHVVMLSHPEAVAKIIEEAAENP